MQPWAWTLLFVAAAFPVVFAFNANRRDRVSEFFFGLFFGLAAAFVLFLVFLGIAVYTENSSKVVESHHIPLKSMTDTSETHGRLYGSLFVQSGYIDQSSVYRFYGQNDSGSYTLATVNAGGSEVVEGNFKEPYATCYWKPAKNIPKFRGWFLDINEDVWENADTARWCTFHIPTGTIKDDFILDTK